MTLHPGISQLGPSLLFNNAINTSKKLDIVQGYSLISSSCSHFSQSPKNVLRKLFCKFFSDAGSNPRLHWIILSLQSQLSPPLHLSFVHWCFEEYGPFTFNMDLSVSSRLDSDVIFWGRTQVVFGRSGGAHCQ